MICYRPFRNTDPPALVEIWNTHPPVRGLAAPMNLALFERHVLSKPYFERLNLIVAADDDNRAIGFVHVGFGTDEQGATLSKRLGAVCLLMCLPHVDQASILGELLQRGEQRLAESGAEVVFGGLVEGADPFYVGLYGGAASPGVLESDRATTALFQRAGYVSSPYRLVFQRTLANFRPVVDRQQIQLRRRYQVEATMDPQERTWWDACRFSPMQQRQFLVRPRTGGPPCGDAVLWDMDTYLGSWSVRAVGLSRIEIEPKYRNQGLGMFLLAEALRQVHGEGVGLMEAHVSPDNTSALRLLKRLEFREIDRGVEFKKAI